MKSYLCTIGEKTTDICHSQLERYGFEVERLDKVEPWLNKYKTFLEKLRDGDDEWVLRIDADIILNKNAGIFEHVMNSDDLIIQFKGFDFYKNNSGVIGVLLYNKKVAEIILNNFDKLSKIRPEATAWRLFDVVNHTKTIDDLLVGMHGFFQSKETVDEAYLNKMARGQLDYYDFDLVNKLRDL